MPASAFTDKKFLIVTYKDGGEDSYHTVISQDPAHIAANAVARPSLTFSAAELSGTYAASRLTGTNFSLHPALQALIPIWNEGDMAITHRVGPMFTDLSQIPIADQRLAARSTYVGSILFPFGMGAHDKQQLGSGSMITREFTDSFGMRRMFAERGFLGALTRRFEPYNSASVLPTSILTGPASPAANALVTDGLIRPLDVPNVGGRYRRDWLSSKMQNSALGRLDAIMARTRSEPRIEAYRQVHARANRSVEFFQPVIEQALGTYAVDQDFPDGATTGWRGTLRTFARAIESDMAHPTLRNRTIFVGAQSGYDTHHSQGKAAGRLAALHADWASAVASFRAAMIRLGCWEQTLLMDHSEFSRSFRENGSAGTDHAYAREAFAIGGAVRGRGRDRSTGLFGTYPAVLSATGTGSFDLVGGQAAAGALSPGISLEEYWEEALRWFGADDQDIADVMPRRASFGDEVNLLFSGRTPAANSAVTRRPGGSLALER